MSGQVLIVDALSVGSGRRGSSRDSIGCGPRTVAGVMERHGIPCRIRRAEDVLFARARTRGFEHLAISAMTMDLPATRSIAALWRRTHARGRIIVGGPIASSPHDVLREVRPDVLVIGEGEATLDELLLAGFLEENIDRASIAGIGYMHGNSPIVTEPRALLSAADISTLYQPSSVRIVDYPAYQASRVYVEAVRGCSNFRRTSLTLPDGRRCSDCSNCDSADAHERLDCPENIPPGCGFCSVPAVWGSPRSRFQQSIVDEVRELLDLGVHRIVLEAPGFLDYMRGSEPLTDPCQPPANLEALTKLLKELASLPQLSEGTAHLSIENLKACLFTDEVADVFSKHLGDTAPNIGIETGSEQHMRQIGKCGSPQDVVRAVKIAKAHGMFPYVYFIYGLPGESSATVEESVNLMRQLDEAGAARIIMYGFRALPGSAFEKFQEPNMRDPGGERLRTAANQINRRKKESYVGRVIRGVAGEPSWSRHGHTMVYPLGDGPLMTVHGGYSPGAIVNVKVTEVLSATLLGGVVV